MLKTGKDVLTKPLCILFNNIIENGVYPKKWNCSIITPVFKGGNSSELNNFRGIAVSSCISKLFTKIINARLVEYCEKKKYSPVINLVLWILVELMIIYS